MSVPTRKPSLATLIRETGKTHEPIETPLTTDERVLARITDGIYRQPASALRELISNAYDADATEVTILTDAPRFSVISVRDDGLGLTPEVLQHLVQHIGGSAKRTSEGPDLDVTSKDDVSRSPGGRQLIGKMGIGLFSVAQFTRHFLIITKTRGEHFRTVADITLGPVSQEQRRKPAKLSDGEKPEIQTGHARIWIEKAAEGEADGQGTEIKLLDLLPRTRAELASQDLWAKIDYERETEGKALTQEPVFHIGRMDRANPGEILVQPNLPWATKDSPQQRFKKLVQAVRGLAETDKDPDIESVCDRYLQTLWSLSLAVPLNYLERHPFDLTSADGLLLFRLENQTKGQSSELNERPGLSARKQMKLKAPTLQTKDRFIVTVDGVQLSRPITFLNQPTTENAVKTPLLFVGRCREDFARKPIELSGGPLEFEAYLFWTPKVLPTQHQGVIVRVGDSSGAPFDPTFMGYQVSEQTRLRQITAEIFVHEGLDGAINIDRESFNYAHPHYQFIVKWLHSAIRQLTNRQKEIGKEKRSERLVQDGEKKRSELDELVQQKLKARGIEDLPEIMLLEPENEPQAARLRRQGKVALSKLAVLPAPKAERQTSRTQQRNALMERKAVAIAQILNAWGLTKGLPFAEQEKLVRDLLEIAMMGVDYGK